MMRNLKVHIVQNFQTEDNKLSPRFSADVDSVSR